MKKRAIKLIAMLTAVTSMCVPMTVSAAVDTVGGGGVTEQSVVDSTAEVNTETDETCLIKAEALSQWIVTIPKHITLDISDNQTGGKDGLANYEVSVIGNIDSRHVITVVPDDAFNMIQGNEGHPATVTQEVTAFSGRDLTMTTPLKTNGSVNVSNIRAGNYSGSFEFHICEDVLNLEQHTHSYTETITKEPTCTEKGEKTYTCICGDTYTKSIDKKGHNYVDGTCVECGAEDVREIALANWDYTLDGDTNTVTLNYYKGNETDVIIYNSYPLNNKVYKTKLANNSSDANSSTNYMFNGSAQGCCSNIESIKFDKGIDVSNVTNMSYMFNNCVKVANLDISNLDTSNVTNMSYMFSNSNSLTSLDLSNFDTSNVTDMSHMFSRCVSLTSLDLSNFDTSNVTDMNNMFSYSNSLTSLDLSNFDTSNVTDMNSMFGVCRNLTSLDLSSFDTSKVTNMNSMFGTCNGLTSLDLSNFNTSNVTNMNGMFGECNSLTSIDLSSFNTGNVTDMRNMFSYSSSLTSLDLSSFDTSNVTKMDYMFYNCGNLQNIYVSNKWIKPMNGDTYMFYDCGVSDVTYK